VLRAGVAVFGPDPVSAHGGVPASSGGQAIAAEAVGTMLLLAAVVGSGVMAERLAAGNDALALLANTLATGAMLVALIAAFGGISGAHFNPLVTAVEWSRRRIAPRRAAGYVAAQCAGAIAGVFAAHAMFGLPLVQAGTHARAGLPQLLSEGIATAGLLVVAGLTGARAAPLAPLAVGGYVAAGYWFTSSTCFANPAVTLARSLSDSFAGIRPADVPPFLLAQVLGAAVGGALVAAWTSPDRARRGSDAQPLVVAERGESR
jgi:glycerol uptake facilitator-like aquaporin